MAEIRASVTEQVHRKLKEEAARSGKHLKALVAELLQAHVARRLTAAARRKGENRPIRLLFFMCDKNTT